IVIHRGRRWVMRFDLSDEEWSVLEPLMPKSRKSARPHDRRIINAIFYVLRTGKYNRFNRWSRRGVWKWIFDALAAKSRDSLYLIDSTIVKAHRAASGAKGGRRISRHSPDDSETSVESSDFAASLEARREIWLATSSSRSPNDGRGVDLAIFTGIC